MSCVVGVVERGGVCMGADSACSGQFVGSLRASTGKMFRSGDMLVGSVGTLIGGQLLRCLEPPERGDVDEAEYLMRQWVPAAAVALKEGEAWKSDPPDEVGFSGDLLIAMGTRLFRLGCDLCVIEDTRGYTAVGSGAAVALGVLYATRGRPAEERVRQALEAAAEHCEGVRPPFVIEWTGRPLHAVA